MSRLILSDHQLALVGHPVESSIFLEGPAGTGKTTAGVGWLLHLLGSGVPARSILVIVPQRTLATPYYETLRRPTVEPGGQVTISTVGGLARRMVDFFWPLVAEEAGFGHPDQPPIFLTLETAQYYMARLVRPLLDSGVFETVVIDRNRLYSQIIDNLNKAAVVGFPHTEIGKRLKAAWGGEQSQKRVYDEAQICATRFREYCLAHNLLDFSLQLELFTSHLWPLPLCRDYLLTTYTHLIVDNVEEDTPVAHDLLKEWLDHCQSALLIYDHEAGYRRFLGADPENGCMLRDSCEKRIAFTESTVTSPALQAFGHELARRLNRPTRTRERDSREKSDLQPPTSNLQPPISNIRQALTYEHHRYHPEMLDWVAGEIAGLVHDEGVPPGEIVVLAPFLTDALRFSLTNRLAQRDVPARSHRPSRALREEPATQCLLTLAAIAHPEWGECPSKFDVAYALMQAIEDLDLVRAQLLAEIVYRVQEGVPTLSSFEQINPTMQERLTFVLGGRYERLRGWIEEYKGRPNPPTPFPAREGGVSSPLPASGREGGVSPPLPASGREGGGETPFPASGREGGGETPLPTSGREGGVSPPLPASGREGRVLSPLPASGRGRGRGSEELDHFLSRLFGELLSQEGYGFHRNYDAGEVTANLIESVQKFRWVTEPSRRLSDTESGGNSATTRGRVALGQEYIEMVQDGVVAAQYILSWQLQPEDAVLLTPAYTFLMSNRPVDYQFWLNVGGRGWWERLYQPLTHPYVLSRGWPRDKVWTDSDEVETRRDALYRLTLGLIRRCRCKVYLGLSELGEQGYEQKGPLLQAIQRVLRRQGGR